MIEGIQPDQDQETPSERIQEQMKAEGIISVCRERLGNVWIEWAHEVDLPGALGITKVIIKSNLIYDFRRVSDGVTGEVLVVSRSDFPFSAFPYIHQMAGNFTFYENPKIPEIKQEEEAYFNMTMRLWAGLEVLEKALTELLPEHRGRFDQMPGSTSLYQVMESLQDPEGFREKTKEGGVVTADQDMFAGDWKLMKDILQKNAEYMASPSRTEAR